MRIFDTHAHYNDERYKDDLDQVLQDNFNSGVEKIINIAYDVESSRISLELSKKYDAIYATVGIHPEDIKDETYNVEHEVRKLERLIENNIDGKLVAIGEIGLDYYYIKENKEKQKELFKAQILLAKKYNLPIVIHCRDASEDMYDMLKDESDMEGKILFHCFECNERVADLVKKRGYMVAFGGNITYKRKDSVIRVIQDMPIDRIVLETDAPYLAPEPHRGERNESKHISHVIEKLAEIKGITVGEVEKETFHNALKFFNVTS